MSADSRQSTLDGRTLDEPSKVTVGSAAILDQADPDTDIRRVASWIMRAKREGVL